MRRLLVVIVSSIVLSIVAQPGIAAEAGPPRPNILLILADNWAYPHASVYGDPVVRTPNFDRVAADGMLFTNAFCVVPSCTPARSLLLTGQPIHRLEAGGNLWGYLPRGYPLYPDMLEAAGYAIGSSGKAWSPGRLEEAGRTRNPAGPTFDSFEAFIETVRGDQPFCFWHGDVETALGRWQKSGAGLTAGLDPAKVVVPPFLPDVPEVRHNILDYYAAAEQFDRNLGEVLAVLDRSGRRDNTLLVVAGDNGWQMPRGLANVYDGGVRVPMAVRWPRKVKRGQVNDAMVDFLDLAPTFLAAAGVAPAADMSGRDLIGLLEGRPFEDRGYVFLERERHANVRQGDASYPCRAIRTRDFLYIRNLRHDLWPAGDPTLWMSVGDYGDVDNSTTKAVILAGYREKPNWRKYYDLAFAKRPAEELYDLRNDPHQMINVAERSEYAETKSRLRGRLDAWMRDTSDPRATNEHDARWDKFPYFGGNLREKK